MITHYDLFAGIGGFSLALEEVFQDATIKHIFCEWESFPTAVLKQHWPAGEYWGDIADLVAYEELTAKHSSKPRPYFGKVDTRASTDTNSRPSRPRTSTEPVSEERLERSTNDTGSRDGFTIVTGGFPCQPFSHAGRRKGTADDRYQWPNMFEVIRNTQPEWVIAENVRGLVTWNDGMVLETVCSDLESEGYEVQPFIIPAVAVGAPHRRDRVWIIGRNPQYAEHTRQHGTKDTESAAQRGDSHPSRTDEPIQSERPDSLRQDNARTYPDWSRNWQEVALATCNDTVDDGLSRLVDGVPYSRAKWRKDSLKAYGNGIVPEVAMNIMQAIKETQDAI